MIFPDEQGYEVSKDGTDLIRPGCSVLLNRLLGSLKQWSTEDKTPRWSLFLMNAATVFRNVYVKGDTATTIREKFMADMENFTVYLEAYLNIVGGRDTRVPVVLYFPDYSAIPKTIAREAGESGEAATRLYKTVASSIAPGAPRLISQGQLTDRWVVPTAGRVMPIHTIISWLHGIVTSGQSGSYKWGDSVCLMTHCAVDLHGYRRLPNMVLWEYFTSAIKPPSQFWTKLSVPKDKPIPFGIVTHRLFGDAVHIKPLVSGRLKTRVLETADNNAWMRLTDDQIIQKVKGVDKAIDLSSVKSFKF